MSASTPPIITCFFCAMARPISARIRTGEFRALAVTGKTRWRDFPDVPTVEEQGIPGFEVISWTGLAGPAKLPPAVVDKLNGELRRAIAVPELKSKLEAMGGDPRATTPAEMRALVARQFATWSKLAKDAKIQVDYSWTRVSEGVLRTTRIAQDWEDAGTGWKLVREKRVQGDLGLFGEPVATTSSEPHEDVQFATKIIQ